MKRIVAILGGLLFASSVAFAQTPVDKGEGYSQIGHPRKGVKYPLTSADTAYDIGESHPAWKPICFAHRTAVVVKAMGGEASCLFADTATMAFAGAADSVNSCMIDDGTLPWEPGACVSLSAGERHDMTPYPYHDHAAGHREGVCSAGLVTWGGAYVYPRCDADGDCTEAGAPTGTTCATSPTAAQLKLAKQQGCSYLICQGDTAGMYVYVGVEQ